MTDAAPAPAAPEPVPPTPEESVHQGLINHMVNLRHSHQMALRALLDANTTMAHHVAQIRALEAKLKTFGWTNQDTAPEDGGPPQV